MTLAGSAWGTFLETFDTVPATIYGTYSGYLDGGLFYGHATGRGTRDLEGYVLDADLQQVPLSAPPGGDPCPGGSVTGLGQTVDSTLRIDPDVDPGASR